MPGAGCRVPDAPAGSSEIRSIEIAEIPSGTVWQGAEAPFEARNRR
jgi:hypothetical protein